MMQIWEIVNFYYHRIPIILLSIMNNTFSNQGTSFSHYLLRKSSAEEPIFEEEAYEDGWNKK